MKYVLIEIGNSHDECLYSQVLFIQATAGAELTFNACEDFRSNALFYTPETLAGSINGLPKPDAHDWYKEPKWQFDHQRQRYGALLAA